MSAVPRITGAKFHWDAKDKSCGILTVSDSTGQEHEFRSYALTVEKLKGIEELVGSAWDAVKVYEVIDGKTE